MSTGARQLRENKSAIAARGAERILRAARKLFITEGGGSFSARGVAKEAGISLGAVQHFFPTKEQLLQATLEYVLGEIRQEYDRLEAALPFSAQARLLAVVDVLIEDIWKQDSRRFFFGFYALSGHSDFAERLMNDMFAHHQRRFARYLGAAQPKLSENECLDLALQITALIDGLMVYTGPGSKAITPRIKLAELVKETTLRLIASP